MAAGAELPNGSRALVLAALAARDDEQRQGSEEHDEQEVTNGRHIRSYAAAARPVLAGRNAVGDRQAPSESGSLRAGRASASSGPPDKLGAFARCRRGDAPGEM